MASAMLRLKTSCESRQIIRFIIIFYARYLRSFFYRNAQRNL